MLNFLVAKHHPGNGNKGPAPLASPVAVPVVPVTIMSGIPPVTKGLPPVVPTAGKGGKWGAPGACPDPWGAKGMSAHGMGPVPMKGFGEWVELLFLVNRVF